ncbi:hypothetical protein PIB30_019906 [Stylosanthes scabra]|uniref:Uncharacterized protein n=1 Tax=Stylosanthes scabra TaxID=79078 RepID=A0ABU6VBG7_9FABA|nr:hypothetical protein [Stylosanthes scabra]
MRDMRRLWRASTFPSCQNPLYPQLSFVYLWHSLQCSDEHHWHENHVDPGDPIGPRRYTCDRHDCNDRSSYQSNKTKKIHGEILEPNKVTLTAELDPLTLTGREFAVLLTHD